MPLSELLWVSY